MKRKSLIVAALTVAALAGCKDSGGGDNGGGETSPASCDDLGWWECTQESSCEWEGGQAGECVEATSTDGGGGSGGGGNGGGDNGGSDNGGSDSATCEELEWWDCNQNSDCEWEGGWEGTCIGA